MTAAIVVDDVSKRFRIPLDRSTTLKYRVVHPRSTSRYADFFALRNVSFDVPDGEFLGIIGHNGCGKSTLLKLLANIYEPSSGRITVNGAVSPFLELGVGFNPELTARENIFLNGAVLGLTRGELKERVDEIIHFAELEQHADQKIKNFSSGMEVRLAFSVAIQANASVLLMDEVLAVGDARFQAKCFDIFGRYKREGRTVVLVTHDLGAVEMYCDRAFLLDHGALIAEGNPAEVCARYRRMVGAQIDADVMASREPSGDAGAAAPDEQSGHEVGTGEIRITKVQLLDARGEEHYTFTNGDPMTVRMRLRVKQAVADPLICGIALHRGDGLHLLGSNTFVEGMDIECPPQGAEFTVDYTTESLRLLNGSYLVSTTVHSRNGQRPYDHHPMAYQFDVVDESGRIGIFDLGGMWTVGSANVRKRAARRPGSHSPPPEDVVRSAADA